MKQGVTENHNRPAKNRTSRNANASLLPQELFRHRLCQEQKRAERSRKHLLLMLIGPADNSNGSGIAHSLAPAAAALSSAIRETDIAGWFEAEATLGVIYIEFGDSNLTHAAKTVEVRVMSVLQDVLTAQQISQLQISFYVFPDDWSKLDDSPASSTSYPDLPETQQKRTLPLLVK